MITTDIRKRLGAFTLDVRFEVGHETVVLFGQSGSGKSLTLASLAGLIRPDDGSIVIGERTVFDAAGGVDLPPQQRNVGYMVQQIALFPHMTADENIAYGLVGWSREDRAKRVAELKALLSLDGLGSRLPAQMSGGQQQRVALARALARPVDALLLDEPFSSLDEALRGDLRTELLRLRQALDIPVIFVTHDLREAYLLADRLVVLDDGKVLQADARNDVFSRPSSRRVAELLGVRNLYRGRVLAIAPDSVEVEVGPQRWRSASWVSELAVGDAVDVAIRSERVVLHRSDRPVLNTLEATVEAEEAYGANHILHMRPLSGGSSIEVDLPARPYEVLGVATQKEWLLELPPGDLHVMRTDSSRAG